MREVKFRGQRVDNGEWVYGYLHMAYTASSGFIEMGFYISEFKNESFIDHEIIGTQSEYTGLKDKNGEEIYEGDILKADEDLSYRFGEIGVVKYNEDHAGFIVEGKWNKNQHHESLTCDVATTSEIIGNIYESSKQLIK